jgi:hypothetical protein
LAVTTQLKLIRDVFEDDFTLGELTAPWGRWFTCEDAFREVQGKPVKDWKIPGMTAIPMGDYRLIINFSNRFQRHLPLLLDVDGYSGIRIHPLNRATESEGCIGLGQGRDVTRGVITSSRAAQDHFQIGLKAALSLGDVRLQVI